MGRLAVTNTHDGIHSATGPGGVWEEYRYDALGRRVLVRSRRLAGTVPQPGGAGNPWSYTERTVWDGDRIVAELRGDGSGGATHGEVESIGTGGIVQNGDAPWGRVQYIHALGSAASGGIDMPVQIERDAVYNDDVIRFTPLTNWRGQVQGAATAPGSGTVPLVWPAARLTLDGLPAETDSNYFWMGSLANSMTDGSGLQYRRNRYYDPGTGRFTQSDPIGLAGGINLYGFAGSDPVNFTDPFGLDPCTRQEQDDCTWADIRRNFVAGLEAIWSGDLSDKGPGWNTGFALGQLGLMFGARAPVRSSVPAAVAPRLSVTIDEGIAEISKGQVRIMGNMSREGDVIILKAAHIEGAGPGTSGLREMRSIIQEFGAQQGVSQIIIQGARRTTGRHAGQVPRPITVDIPR